MVGVVREWRAATCASVIESTPPLTAIASRSNRSRTATSLVSASVIFLQRALLRVGARAAARVERRLAGDVVMRRFAGARTIGSLRDLDADVIGTYFAAAEDLPPVIAHAHAERGCFAEARTAYRF